MTPNFLLEIGTEELPAGFARIVGPQLKKLVETEFSKKHIQFQEISCTSTPRRILLTVEGLPVNADDDIKEVKGPSYAQAFSNGIPTPAALGFAKRYNIQPESLKTINTSKGKFVCANSIKTGEEVTKLLNTMIPNWINALQGNRFMRWANGDIKFSRPIRWLLCIFNNELLSIEIPGCDSILTSSNITMGHRLNTHSFPINSIESYYEALSNSGVIVDRIKRMALIKELVDKACLKLKSIPEMPNNLVEELTDLVEAPYLIECEFEESFLSLPPEVLSVVMRVHQRYIPLKLETSNEDPLALTANKILLPKFLCISNGLEGAKSQIKRGNEKVISARFSDARYFLNSDKSINSSERINKLNNVTFAEGLGSLFQRVQRIEWLAHKLISVLNISTSDADNLIKAAYFCKHDLVSEMVREFPELQGVIGAKYLLFEGFHRDIALAVLEHYLPTSSSGKVPSSLIGKYLALIDKLELLLSIFATGYRPTGSSDPYALKRACNGIILIITSLNIKIDFNKLLLDSVIYWSSLFPELRVDQHRLLNSLKDFFRVRILSLLEENNIDNDIALAVAGNTLTIESLLNNLSDVFERALLLNSMRKTGTLKPIQIVVSRIVRLAEKSELSHKLLSANDFVNPQLFEKDCEHNMLKITNSLESIVFSSSPTRYKDFLELLSLNINSLNEFFDGDQSVMVMTDNHSIRNNRLSLLAIFRNQTLILADFNLII